MIIIILLLLCVRLFPKLLHETRPLSIFALEIPLESCCCEEIKSCWERAPICPKARLSRGKNGGYLLRYGYGSIPINTIFSGMNIHLPAILMFTRGTRF